MNGVAGAILAAGRGTRMGSIGRTYPKALLPVGNRPVISHHLTLLASLGIREVTIVVGHHAAAVRALVGDGSGHGVSVRYVEQVSALGSADAVGQLRGHIDGPFVLLLGDYFVSLQAPERLTERLAAGDSAIVVKEEPDQRLLAEACEVAVAADGRVARIVEKPRRPKGVTKGCGVYALQPEFFDAVARTPRTALRDEYEITVALELHLSAGQPLYAEPLMQWDANLTRPLDVLACNLEWLRRHNLPHLVDPLADVPTGMVLEQAIIGPGARVADVAALHRVVVFPDGRLQGRRSVSHALVTSEECIPCGSAPSAHAGG